MILSPSPRAGMTGRRPHSTILRRGSPQAVGLVLWVPCQGAPPGRAFDYSYTLGFGDGTSFGSGPTVTETGLDPIFGPVLACNGTAAWQFPTTVLEGQTHGSMSLWVKRRTATPPGEQGAGMPMQYDGDLILQSVYPWIDGVIYTSCFQSGRQSGSPRSDVDRTEWHLITITTSPGANGWTFYQNGLVAFTKTGLSTIPTTWRSGMGNSIYAFDGFWCDLRLYNRCLSAAEVFALWHPETRWDLYATGRAARMDWTAIRQQAYRFRSDDGSEATATALAAANTPITREREINTRLRVQIVAIDPDTSQYSLQYRKKGTNDPWRTVQP